MGRRRRWRLPYAPLGRRASIAAYGYLTAVAVACLVLEPSDLAVVAALLPFALGSGLGGWAEARRQGIAERPFSAWQDAVFVGVCAGLFAICANLVFAGSGRWFGLTLLGLFGTVDLLDRLRWRRARRTGGLTFSTLTGEGA